MTKKKIDEDVTLHVSHQAENGVIVNSQIKANDLVELAALLKNSGITSSQFNGAATLIDDSDKVNTTISAPSLRHIMNMMEPMFKAVGDAEAFEEPVASEVCSDCEDDLVDDLDGDVIETANFDFGHGFDDDFDGEYKAISSMPGNADSKIRNTGMHGDNALAVESLIKSFKDYLKETETVEEAPRVEYSERIRKYGPPVHMNGNIGYSTLDGIETNENTSYAIKKEGLVVVAIERNGKFTPTFLVGNPGFEPGRKITAVNAQRHTLRRGQILAVFTADEYFNNRDEVAAKIEELGIARNRKIPIMTLD